MAGTVSGHMDWPSEAPVWAFNWTLVNGNSEAIAFKDVYFRGKKVFHKASLPMIRVKYSSSAGPYKDSLSVNNLKEPVKIYEHNQSGFRHLVVESYHKIVKYHLVNRWFFRDDGVILPQLHSAGIQHPSTHRHHVYWRFDFDIDGEAANNLPLQHFPDQSTNWGYGAGWRPLKGEGFITDYPGSGRECALLNKETYRGYKIARGPNDADSDAFSPFDGAALVYHGAEDLKGLLGTPEDDGLYAQMSGENVDGADVVFWYIAHLHHHYPSPESEWHVCGPILVPFGY
ncbi:hypothetical protein [Nocardia niwae]|uniref:hypothetical protein n=1 Tax=Nocardia niwae TaxID=626084 RepID=UPI003411DC2B